MRWHERLRDVVCGRARCAPYTDACRECGICLDDKPLTLLGCGHEFCRDCLLQQLRFSAHCAMCRTPMAHCSPPLCQPRDDSGTYAFEVKAHEELRASVATRENARGGAPTVVFCRVFPGGPAERHGVARDDVLVSINGVPCYCVSAVQHLLEAPACRLRVRRRGVRRREVRTFL